MKVQLPPANTVKFISASNIVPKDIREWLVEQLTIEGYDTMGTGSSDNMKLMNPTILKSICETSPCDEDDEQSIRMMNMVFDRCITEGYLINLDI